MRTEELLCSSRLLNPRRKDISYLARERVKSAQIYRINKPKMLSEIIRQQVIQYLNAETDVNNWVLNDSEIISRDCNVYCFSSEEYTHDVALKIYHNKQKTRKSLHHFEALLRFEKSLNTQNLQFKVPKPIASFPDDHYFLMEWVEGQALEERLWRKFYSKKHQQTDIKHTYCWLKEYHRVAKPSLGKVDTDFFIKQLETHITKHNGQSLKETNAVFAEALKTFTAQTRLFSELPVNFADNHGDFTPSNIILGEDHITAIDIGGNQSLPIEVDMALMLNYICIEYPFMLTKGDMKKPPSHWAIFKLALDAYQYSSDPQQRHFFLFVFQYQMLRRWLIINNRDTSKQRSPLLEKRRSRQSEKIVSGVNHALLTLS